MTDRLQQAAEQIVRKRLDIYSTAISSENLREQYDTQFDCTLAGLTAGIAMAAERSDFNRDSLAETIHEANNDCPNCEKFSVLRERGEECGCYQLADAIINKAIQTRAALAKGETQHG